MSSQPMLRRVQGMAVPAAAVLGCGGAWGWCWSAWSEPAYSGGGRWLFMLAIALAIGNAWRMSPHALSASWLFASAGLVAMQGVSIGHVPMLANAMLAAAAWGCAVLASSRGPCLFGRWGVSMLPLFSLPLGHGVDYYVGFPLRILVTLVSAWLLGPAVDASGTALVTQGYTIFVDAPCSGVRMLGTSLALAALLGALVSSNFSQTILLFLAAGLLALLGNVARALALFAMETGQAPSFSHESVGLGIFAVCMLLLGKLSLYLRGNGRENSNVTEGRNLAQRWALICFVGIVLVSTITMNSGKVEAGFANLVQTGEVRWPTHWDDRTLSARPMEPGMEHFLQDFPGEMAEFGIEGTEQALLLRYTKAVSRKLHPAELCYRGAGWHCMPLPAYRDQLGHLWSCFEAKRSDGKQVLVRQLYLHLDPEPKSLHLEDWLKGSKSWPDAAAWFWQASMPVHRGHATLGLTWVSPLAATS